MNEVQLFKLEPVIDREDCRVYILHLCIPATIKILHKLKAIAGIDQANIRSKYGIKLNIAECFEIGDVLNEIAKWADNYVGKIMKNSEFETGGSVDAPCRLKQLLRKES